MTIKEWQPLTIPHISWNKETLTSKFGELQAEPLAPGFGITFGNALRRVLLGSVEGAAVTSVIIRGVNNEFSVLPGVVEDVMQVVLNIKEIVVRSKTGKPGTMRITIEGERVAKVADIIADEHLELMNPDHVIAHVAAGGTLEITFFVEPGRGYRLAQWPLGQSLQKDDRIYLDAMFSPIRRVTFDVQKTRVGEDIDYDALKISIDTNGATQPVEAVHYAVSVLRNQLQHFLIETEIPFNEMAESETVAPEQSNNVAMTPRMDPALHAVTPEFLLKPIDALEFSVRANNCLVNAGIKRIIDLVNLSEDEVKKIKNFGSKSLAEVQEGMKAFGLKFGMNIREESLKKARKKE
jgi:DNA-directed RNA polymerase subunit alpha